MEFVNIVYYVTEWQIWPWIAYLEREAESPVARE